MKPKARLKKTKLTSLKAILNKISMKFFGEIE